MMYDPETFCDLSMDPNVDIHNGWLPPEADTKGRAIVYIATCRFPPGNSYVGITEKGLGPRRARHIWEASHGSKLKFHRALRKHGPENFFWHVLEVWPDYWAALAAERKVIRILAPAYNLTSGGGGVKGLKMSPEARAKMSAAKSGKPGIWARQPMPATIRARLAQARRSEKGITRPKLYRAVIHLPTGVEFPSVKSAAEAHKTDPGSIVRWCKKGKRFAYKTP